MYIFANLFFIPRKSKNQWNQRNQENPVLEKIRANKDGPEESGPLHFKIPRYENKRNYYAQGASFSARFITQQYYRKKVNGMLNIFRLFREGAKFFIGF